MYLIVLRIILLPQILDLLISAYIISGTIALQIWTWSIAVGVLGRYGLSALFRYLDSRKAKKM